MLKLETENFELKFAKIYPYFTSNLIKTCNELTSSEVRVCMLLRMSYQNKDIIKKLDISNSTLTNLRSSIRKKIGLKRSESLTNFIISI
jgi:DNA-binding CsgD family transcriptional regulator